MDTDESLPPAKWMPSLPTYTRVLMDNLSPAQYDRFEAYRRYALSKQAVRKVCNYDRSLDVQIADIPPLVR